MKEKERSISLPIAQNLLGKHAFLIITLPLSPVSLLRSHLIPADVFAVWREATRRKVALHATRIRRTRPSQAHASDHVAGPRSRRVSPLIPAPAPPRVSILKETSHAPSGRRVSMPSSLRPREDESVVSEPACSRLRSELYSRRRVASEEPESRNREGGGERERDSPSGTSELVRQLRGALR